MVDNAKLKAIKIKEKEYEYSEYIVLGKEDLQNQLQSEEIWNKEIEEKSDKSSHTINSISLPDSKEEYSLTYNPDSLEVIEKPSSNLITSKTLEYHYLSDIYHYGKNISNSLYTSYKPNWNFIDVFIYPFLVVILIDNKGSCTKYFRSLYNESSSFFG